jgi:hypothetical protein
VHRGRGQLKGHLKSKFFIDPERLETREAILAIPKLKSKSEFQHFHHNIHETTLSDISWAGKRL